MGRDINLLCIVHCTCYSKRQGRRPANHRTIQHIQSIQHCTHIQRLCVYATCLFFRRPYTAHTHTIRLHATQKLAKKRNANCARPMETLLMSPKWFNHSIIKKPVEHTKDPNKFCSQTCVCAVRVCVWTRFVGVQQTWRRVHSMFRTIDSVVLIEKPFD